MNSPFRKKWKVFASRHLQWRWLKTRDVLPLIFLCLLFIPAAAQDAGTNPFELSPRQDSEKQALGDEQWAGNPFDLPARRTEPATEALSETAMDNPFELAPSTNIRKNTTPSRAERPLTVAGKNRGRTFRPPSYNLLFWICTALLLLYTLGFSLAGGTIRQCYQAFTNENFLKLLHRQNRRKQNLTLLYFQLLAILSIGLFAFLTLARYEFPLTYNFSLYLLLSAGIAGLYLGKKLLLFLVENLFLLHKPLSRYRFTLSIFLLLLGLFLFPANALLAFTTPPVENWSFFAGAGLIGLFFIYRYLRGLFVARKYLAFHKSHFFLYLCTVEIAPAVLILKLLLDFAAKA